MPSFSLEFEVYCETCGAGLCNQSEVDDGSRGPRVNVEVCGNCLETARQEGYDEGYKDGEYENS